MRVFVFYKEGVHIELGRHMTSMCTLLVLGKLFECRAGYGFQPKPLFQDLVYWVTFLRN